MKLDQGYNLTKRHSLPIVHLDYVPLGGSLLLAKGIAVVWPVLALLHSHLILPLPPSLKTGLFK